MVEVFAAAELVDDFDVVLPFLRESIEEYVFAEGALEAAFRAGSVVPGDVDDEGVVAAGKLLDGIDDAAEFVVALRGIAREDFHHARVETLLVGVDGVPCGQALGTNGELGVFGDDAEFFLALESVLAILVPAFIKFAFEFIDPLFRGLVWSVSGSGSDVEEEGMSGRDAVGLTGPCDGFVGDVGGEVVGGILGARDEIAVLVEDGIPVIHVSGIEAVEVVEAEAVGPVVEGAGGAGLPSWSVVVLADPGGHVSVLAEDFADRATAFGKDAGVAVVSCGCLCDAG